MLAKGRNTDSVYVEIGTVLCWPKGKTQTVCKSEIGIVLCWPKGTTQTVCKLKLELCYVGQRAQHKQCKLKLELCYVGQRAQHSVYVEIGIVLCWPKGTTQCVS